MAFRLAARVLRGWFRGWFIPNPESEDKAASEIWLSSLRSKHLR